MEASLRDLWRVVDDLSRIRAPSSRFYRVTIFGSARMQPGERLYNEVRDLASQLAALGCDIVTGGGPGLMQAANEGEQVGDPDNRTRSFGLPIELPHEEAANPFVERVYKHRTFFTRLHHFVRLSDAFIVVRGGIGTSLEALMVWQLCQVRHVYDKPFILVGEMWKDLVQWARNHMIHPGRNLADPQDLSIPFCAATIEEAVARIRDHKAQVDGAGKRKSRSRRPSRRPQSGG
ncbi:MAG: LOG family protein [Gemmatimonadota bacterium]|nr:MAG: LOG family protein [Gemmatimonadota bacterium]